MRQSTDFDLFPGVFAPVLSLDELCAIDDSTGERPFDLTDPEPLPDEQVERAERLLAVNTFVASLPNRDQDIVRRVFWDSQSQSDVARQIGVSKMAISKAMARICKRGRAALAAYENLALAQ